MLSSLFLPSLDPDPNKKLGVWIWIHIDILGIPVPHKNLCGSEILVFPLEEFVLVLSYRYILNSFSVTGDRIGVFFTGPGSHNPSREPDVLSFLCLPPAAHSRQAEYFACVLSFKSF